MVKVYLAGANGGKALPRLFTRESKSEPMGYV